ncbi:hypothetical protein Bca52824_014998 [Brassica carinata]|uniref:TF-B3 domain-containing protein n=1 Tax=Brassica carinata TaxID=52824 RepID=A0A8X7W3K8_BRACI|nr:hypothetical protein Bca52824_014998 [Brassica carinata]
MYDPDKTEEQPTISAEMAHSHQPHLFQPLLPGFQTGLNIPIAFSRGTSTEHHRNRWTLRSGARDNTWEVLQEERRLTRGWKEFTEAHDLRVGDIVIFKLEGEIVFHLSPFDPSCCDIQYTAPNVPASAYSWDYSFRAEVTETNVEEDKLALPVEATDCKALNKQCKEATLVNIDGKPWTVALRFSESRLLLHHRVEEVRHDNKCASGTCLPSTWLEMGCHHHCCVCMLQRRRSWRS